MPELVLLVTGGLWIASILAGLLYFAPLAYQRGHRTVGGFAIIITVALGPLGFLVLLPWALANRDDRAD